MTNVWAVCLCQKHEGIDNVDLYSSDYTLDEIKDIIRLNLSKTTPELSINFETDEDYTYLDLISPYYIRIEKMLIIEKVKL